MASTISSPGALPTAVLQQTHSAASVTTASADSQNSHEELVKQKQEELQKKLMEEGEPTLQQQESMSIKGQNARHLVMQRLMRPRDSKVVILRNMVGPEDVDETLQEEIQEECSKFGSVERVVIYKEKQTDNEDDDFDDVLVKIFVEFSVSGGKLCNKLLYLNSVSWNIFAILLFRILEADKASSALNGRFFAGRLVKAESYDQALFDHNDFTGWAEGSRDYQWNY